MELTRVIIAGGRDFYDQALLTKEVDKVLKELLEKAPANFVFVSGNAPGADQEGEVYARRKGYSVFLYPAYWKVYGRRAGIVRNEQMAQNADVLIAFWDGKSKGTDHMIKIANKYSLKVYVVRY